MWLAPEYRVRARCSTAVFVASESRGRSSLDDRGRVRLLHPSCMRQYAPAGQRRCLLYRICSASKLLSTSLACSSGSSHILHDMFDIYAEQLTVTFMLNNNIFANLEVDHPHPFSLPFVSPLLLV